MSNIKIATLSNDVKNKLKENTDVIWDDWERFKSVNGGNFEEWMLLQLEEAAKMGVLSEHEALMEVIEKQQAEHQKELETISGQRSFLRELVNDLRKQKQKDVPAAYKDAAYRLKKRANEFKSPAYHMTVKALHNAAHEMKKLARDNGPSARVEWDCGCSGTDSRCPVHGDSVKEDNDPTQTKNKKSSDEVVIELNKQHNEILKENEKRHAGELAKLQKDHIAELKAGYAEMESQLGATDQHWQERLKSVVASHEVDLESLGKSENKKENWTNLGKFIFMFTYDCVSGFTLEQAAIEGKQHADR